MSFFTNFWYTSSDLWGEAPLGVSSPVSTESSGKPLSPLGKAVGGNPKPLQPRPGYLAGSPLVRSNPTENPEGTLYRPFSFLF